MWMKCTANENESVLDPQTLPPPPFPAATAEGSAQTQGAIENSEEASLS